ncbi:hypothetical protein H6G65_10130 [Microcystis elabens FACHB-917]|nr:hypothetical protein [Microcystis elabens FACHB-917]
MNRLVTGIVSQASLLFVTLPMVTLPLAVAAPEARAQGNPWGAPSQQTPVQTTPWGGGGGTGGGGYGRPGNRTLTFPVQGVICDRSVSVCFNANGVALAETEQEFGRRARRTLENNLVNNPIVDVTFADGRYCNFNLRGCWTNRQRTSFDPRLNPWVFGAGAGAGTPGGQGTVIGGAGSTWGPGGGTINGQLPTNSFQAPFTRTRQSGTCAWTNAGISIYDGTCRYEIVQNNTNGSKALAFTFDRLPVSNPLRTLRFTAQGNGPWSIQMPNGSAAAVQSRVNADQYSTNIQLGWSNVFSLGFRSSTQATTAQLNQALQPVDANGQVVQGSDSEALGQALGGLLQQLFGGGRQGGR